eukprot:TRINITY_DN26138_c0_g2_i3.p1 TRINITY_DN26138_c0_g2~~TRINITY_DN26138_c0_g2_i3.p1  ORF type:complete len:273 (-),score=36.10 TRINITY_DN26138_c0_g2_i3:520-1338(-)
MLRSLVGSEMCIRDRFKLSDGGNKLMRIQSKSELGKDKTVAPSRVLIGGATFVSKGDSLVRAPGQKSKNLKLKSTKRSLKLVRRKANKSKSLKSLCMFFTKYGKCSKGDKCEFAHDSSKVAVCSKFLRGMCEDKSCPLSHTVSANKMAVCQHFLTGICNNDDCPYLHVKVSSKAAVCKQFLQGFCARGAQCPKKHVTSCQAFVQGRCQLGDRCELYHAKPKPGGGHKRKTRTPTQQPTAPALKRIKPEFEASGADAAVVWPSQRLEPVRRHG